MVGVVESEGGSLADGHRARVARRIRRMTGMQGLGGGAEFAGGSVVVSHSYSIPRQAWLEILEWQGKAPVHRRVPVRILPEEPVWAELRQRTPRVQWPSVGGD